MNIGKVLDRLLDGRTKTWLARESGLSLTAVNQIVNDKKQVTLPSLRKIAKALKTDMWRIVREAEQADKEGKQ